MTIRKGTDNSSFLSPNLERGTSKLNKKKKKISHQDDGFSKVAISKGHIPNFTALLISASLV